MIDNVKIEVLGVKDALRELNSIDKKARRQVTIEYRKIVQPAVSAAQSMIPTYPPMSGWARAWAPNGRGEILPYNGQRSRKAVAAFISSRRPQEFAGMVRNLSAFGFQWKSADARLFDTAQHGDTPAGRRMAKVLNLHFGRPSRIMWKAWAKESSAIQAELAKLIEDVMARVNRNIKVGA